MRKVLTYGTFDLFHQGHYNILKRAKEEGDFLIVGVTGERYDAERGKLSVQDSLATRIENVKKTGFADMIIVEEYLGQKIFDIMNYNVDVLVVGSDWKGKFDHLRKYCEVKYLERTKNISSTQIREESMKILSFGIATDSVCDNNAILETKSVSGIHAESVYSSDRQVVDQFVNKYELDSGFDNYDEFLDSVDIVYIKTKLENRAKLVEQALMKGKSVICDAPISKDHEDARRYEQLAYEKGLCLLRNITTNYLQAFGQLLWIARSNLIGDIVSVKAKISKKDFEDRPEMNFYDVAYYAISAIVKIMGASIERSDCKYVRNEKGEIIFGQYTVYYPNAVATAEISMDVDFDNAMKIIGTDGSIDVPDDWWRVGYFKAKTCDKISATRYTSNFDGNGFRYLIRAMQQILKQENNAGDTTQGISAEESTAIHNIIFGE